MKSNQLHVFALFCPELSNLISRVGIGQVFEIKNGEIRSRLVNILRLRVNESVLLFDEKINAKFALHTNTFESKNLFLILKKVEQNRIFKPEIILCVGLLKKKFFESICYMAAQMGVNKIVPILMQRVHQNWFNEKTKDRLKKILIAGAEQSKSFFIPHISSPVDFKNFVVLDCEKKVCFDVSGKKLIDLLKNLDDGKPEKIQLLFGPESGFSENELKLIQENNFEFCKLTPTILRSVEAIAVGLGSVRSVVF